MLDTLKHCLKSQSHIAEERQMVRVWKVKGLRYETSAAAPHDHIETRINCVASLSLMTKFIKLKRETYKLLFNINLSRRGATYSCCLLISKGATHSLLHQIFRIKYFKSRRNQQGDETKSLRKYLCVWNKLTKCRKRPPNESNPRGKSCRSFVLNHFMGETRHGDRKSVYNRFWWLMRAHLEESLDSFRHPWNMRNIFLFFPFALACSHVV